MAELVMLDLDPGPAFVDALRQVWEAGDAAFPLDRRLPALEAERVVATAAPTAVVDAAGDRRSLNGGRPVLDGDAVVVATSGTTGEPKAVIHTHGSVAASADATSAALDVDPTTDRWLACLPPAHIGGLAVIMRALVTDTPLIALPGSDPADIDTAARNGATLVSVVTRILNRIDVHGFRKVLIGGAAPPPDLPGHVIPTYGMTETGSGIVYGRHPLVGVELREAESGEIEIRAPMLLRAYRTAAGDQSPLDAEGWFPSGDMGHIEPDGRLWIDGRMGDVIITGGEKVWPSRLERLIERHPAVAEAAVIGRPDPDWGHRVVAVIVAEANPPSLADIRTHVMEQLPVWNAPKDLEIVDRLPKTALGKVRRADL